MNTKHGILLMLVVAVLFLAGLSALVQPAAYPLQAAEITPVAQTARGTDPARVANFFSNEALTADARRCFDLAGYEVIDLQYVVDQGTLTNPLTMTLEYSNDNANFEVGPSVATDNSADASALKQYALFGRWGCVNAEVTNTNTVTLTVIGVAK